MTDSSAVYTSILEDGDITADEFRVLLYLVAKETDFPATESVVLKALPAMRKNAVRVALGGLRQRGYVVTPRSDNGRYGPTYLVRELVSPAN